MEVNVTEEDRQMARDALVQGWHNCRATATIENGKHCDCDCDLGAIDGCKARIEEIAKAIATARTMNF